MTFFRISRDGMLMAGVSDAIGDRGCSSMSSTLTLSTSGHFD